MSKPKFPMLLQIGIIVRNVEDAIRNYEEMFGMGPWRIQEFSGKEAPSEDLTVDGIPRKEDVCRLAFHQCYGMEIELIEPIADSQYKDWLLSHGPGIHHIAAVTEEDYDSLLENYRQSTGREPWIRGVGINGLMDFSYLDFREETGLMVECYRNLDPERPGIPYEHKASLVKDLS